MAGTEVANSTPYLELKGITKAYPGVVANDNVTFTVGKGEIHALLGENGAGKSTLVKILYGLVTPDAGTVSIDGQEVQIANPVAARKLGVGMVFQHFSLFDSMTVLENIALGLGGERPSSALAQKVISLSEVYGLGLEPYRSVQSLSVGEKQRVEIARTLLQNPQLLVLDEPTSVLTPQEADQLFKTLRKFAAEGRSIIYISHKLDEIKALCDKTTVLRGGKVIGSYDPSVETVESLAEKMIGKRVESAERTERGSISDQTVFELEALSGGDVKDASLSIKKGEIVGVAGVAGNGQEELIQLLSGEISSAKTSIQIDGSDLGETNPSGRRNLGLRVLPEERIGHAAVSNLSLWQNVFLTRHQEKASSKWFMPSGWLKAEAVRITENFDVRHSGVDANMGSLSGGNMQKFIVGREVETAPKVFVVAQPTWGVDKGAAVMIHKALSALADKGASVLVVSQDLDELLTLSDRICVMHEGKLGKAKATKDWTVTDLGLEMAGLDSKEAAHV